MSGAVWSKVIDGVTVTVDVDATRAAYASCNYGLGCDCADCKLAEPLLASLLSAGLTAFLTEFGVDPFKPLEFISIHELGRWHLAQLWYECIGGIFPEVYATAGLEFEGATVTFGEKIFARHQFSELPALKVYVEFDLERFTHIVQGANRDE